MEPLSMFGKKKKFYARVYKMIFPNTYLTYELWNDIRNFCIQNENLRQQANGIVQDIYKFNKKTKEAINQLISKLELNEPYVGFHIRCGDKAAEHKLENISSYVNKAELHSNFKTAFVFTDYFHIVEIFRKDFPKWKVYTLTKHDENGFIHYDFIKKTMEENRKSIIQMFASMEMLRNS